MSRTSDHRSNLERPASRFPDGSAMPHHAIAKRVAQAFAPGRHCEVSRASDHRSNLTRSAPRFPCRTAIPRDGFAPARHDVEKGTGEAKDHILEAATSKLQEPPNGSARATHGAYGVPGERSTTSHQVLLQDGHHAQFLPRPFSPAACHTWKRRHRKRQRQAPECPRE